MEYLPMLKEAGGMFLFLSVELTILFLLISYIVGVLQEYIPPEKIQKILSSKNGKGYIVAGLMGSITPFCSCSTIPFLKGLLRANAGFGPMMVFLFTSPLLNPIIIGLFFATFGMKVTVSYFILAMGVSVVAGYLLEKLGFEKYIKPEAYLESTKSNCSSSSKDSSCGEGAKTVSEEIESDCNSTIAEVAYTEPTLCCATGGVKAPKVEVSSSSSCSTSSGCGTSSSTAIEESKWIKIWRSTWSDFVKVVPYLFGGIAIGAFIYGFIPTEFIAKYSNKDSLLSIPIAAVIGIPLYIRAEAVIPLSAALVTKGMGLGAVMALIIGSAGASLTEVILLKSIFKNKMIAAFLFVILGMAIMSGFIFRSML
tara:strand:+ start:1062 stop:2162 length:1101 start_codon:yes stop_codon:yes gene_type:complete